MTAVREIKVGLDFGCGITPVGRLAERQRKIYFEYHKSFLTSGLDLSPLHLPLKAGVASFANNLFAGLPGVFDDSLPDGWGRLLIDRFARSKGIMPAELTPLDRLTYVGRQGMGALVYEPDQSLPKNNSTLSLDQLAHDAAAILVGTPDAVIRELLSLNGSAAGARPKAMIGLDTRKQSILHGTDNLPESYDHWIVKFSHQDDGADAGAIEYVYALMARDAGLLMPEAHLFSAAKGAGYFAVRRFDRNKGKRWHMHTAAGLLHADFRIPALDYSQLMALAGHLTKDQREMEKLLQLAVFNVLAHNRDDHGKNVSFLMDATGQWRVSPPYDLTFSSGPGGEHSTLIMGEGRTPTIDHLLQLGNEHKLAKKRCTEIIERTKAALAQWPQLAKTHGVSTANIRLIGTAMKNW